MIDIKENFKKGYINNNKCRLNCDSVENLKNLIKCEKIT